jgi:hypothetical protein
MVRNIVGPPARGADFFDREEQVELLWNRLETGNVLLAAPRRFGKTSLMYRLLDEPQPGWKPIHVDAESIREPVNFIVALLDALMADRQIRKFLVTSWNKAYNWARGLIEDVTVSAPGTGDVGLKIKLKNSIGVLWQDRGEALLRSLRTFDKRKKILIIIDELPIMLSLFRDHGMEDTETRAFLYWFRKLRTDPRIGLLNCRFLVGGSIGIDPYLSRLEAVDSFNDFERMPLGELHPDKAAVFLKALLESRSLKINAEAQKAVLDLIGAPIPYFIQVFVSEIASAVAAGATRIGPKSIEELYHNRILSAACKTYFQHYADRLRHYEKPEERAAKDLLKELALAPEPGCVGAERLMQIFTESLGVEGTRDAFARIIGELENDFYVRYRTRQEGYAFASKILRDWWRRYYAF